MEFENIIEVVKQLNGVEHEICGSWLWVSGDTKNHKTLLKELGLYYAPKKQMWYKQPSDAPKTRYRKQSSMEQIRSKYGSSKED